MSVAPEVTPDDKRAAVERVLQSTAFVRAEQLRNFLRFICEMEMSGRASEITEYLIGVEALGRAPGYSTAEDSIVRRRAIDLREKLDELYTGELASAPIRIELPKGRYVPRFVPAPPPPPPVEEAASPVAAPPAIEVPRRLPSRVSFAAGFVAGALVASLAFLSITRRAPWAGAQPKPGVVYEGEAAGNTLHGAATVGECEVCSGGARVRNIGNSNSNYVIVNGVSAASAGNYTLHVDYFLQGERSFFVGVNGADPIELPVKGESWYVPATATLLVPLKAGANTLKFGNANAYAPDLDRIAVR